MTIPVRCPHCGVVHQVADQMAGTQARCQCGGVLTIPATSRPQPTRDSGPSSSAGRAVAKIVVQCPKCGRKHQADRSLAGTAARCSCGTILQIPKVRTSAAPQASARGAAAQRSRPTQSPPPQAPASGVGSLFDELTDSDWSRTLPKKEEPEEPGRPSDDEVLASYTKDYRPSKQAPTDLASRWKRWAGAMLDGIIMTIVMVPLICLLTGAVVGVLKKVPSMEEYAKALTTENAPDSPAGDDAQSGSASGLMTEIIARLVLSTVFLLVWFVAFLLVNGYLLFRRGQTVGKLIVGTKIVNVDSEVPGLAKVAVLRYFVPAFLGLVVPFFGFIDAVMIFGEQRRCAHDHFAGTYVVNT